MNYNENLELKNIEYFCEIDQVFKIERWVDIKGYEDKYQVSDLGRVKSMNYDNRLGEKVLLLQNLVKGHKGVRLYINGKAWNITVQVLVAIAFLGHVPCGHDVVVDHIDNVPYNNYYKNLQLVSSRINTTKDRKSEHVGVHWCKNKSKWRAEIHIKMPIFLGRYNDLEKAKKVYSNALKSVDKFDGCRKRFRNLVKSL